MNNYLITIEYDGSNYVGWQRQKNGISVQEIIEKKIQKILKTNIKIIGSGRTDKGVHARAQSANFLTVKKIHEKKKFLNSINFFLNKKLISIIDIKLKSKKFHARFSAKKRIYNYVIFNRNISPSIYINRGWHIKKKLDIKLMKKGAKILEGTHDFSTYRSSKCSAKNPVRKIDFIKIKKIKSKIEIKFKSQSFLQQQVRSMVGCLKYLGENKWNLKVFRNVLNLKKRKLCAPPAPAYGLYLEKVIY